MDPSEGFEIKAGWTSASNDGGYLLLEVSDVAVLLEFSAKFKDLIDQVEITPWWSLVRAIGVLPRSWPWPWASWSTRPTDRAVSMTSVLSSLCHVRWGRVWMQRDEA